MAQVRETIWFHSLPSCGTFLDRFEIHPHFSTADLMRQSGFRSSDSARPRFAQIIGRIDTDYRLGLSDSKNVMWCQNCGQDVPAVVFGRFIRLLLRAVHGDAAA